MQNRSPLAKWIFGIAVLIVVTGLILPKYLIRARTGGGPTCYSMLLQIMNAKEQVAIDKKLSPGDAVTDADVAAFVKGGLPKCPKGGHYTLGKVGEPPRCDFPEHANLNESLPRNDSVESDPNKK